ncbi:MAG: hypothetical protein WC346_08110 [Methanogenium sp.]|jgi:hypothetical protein
MNKLLFIPAICIILILIVIGAYSFELKEVQIGGAMVIQKTYFPTYSVNAINSKKQKVIRIYPEKYSLTISTTRDTIDIFITKKQFESIEIGDYVTSSM